MNAPLRKFPSSSIRSAGPGFLCGVASAAACGVALTVSTSASASVLFVKVDALLTAQAWQGFISNTWYETQSPNITGLTKQAGIAYNGTSALTQMSALSERIVFHFETTNGPKFQTPNLARAMGSIWFLSPTAQAAQFFVTDALPDQGSWAVAEMELHDLTVGDSLVSSWTGTTPPSQASVLGANRFYRLDFDIPSLAIPGEAGNQAIELRFGDAVPAPSALALALLGGAVDSLRARRRRR